VYRSILVYDITGATNIAGTAYDTAATPVAPNGVLVSAITPATSTVLIDMNDAAQLAKFGLNNGPVDNANTLSEKWEALALVPVNDPAAPNDWFLFVGNDNDFITTNGFQDGAPYAAAFDNDSMILVYRLTLPGRLLNLSSRAQSGGAAGPQIVGFVVSGAKPKQMLVRGVGPALTALGVTGALTDPTLTIFDQAGRQILANDNWADNAATVRNAAVSVGAFALTDGSRDAALLATLDPGAYTALVTGVGSASGVSLLEIYELP
jgi:hypothetical protein